MDRQQLFEDVVSQLAIGVCIVDPAYNLLYWNNFFADRLQMPMADVEGKSILELFPDQATFLKRKLQSVFVLKNASFLLGTKAGGVPI
jgi:transcriptional regulator with PAS, ATPase and Fis domain